jgi:hypothetical protein
VILSLTEPENSLYPGTSPFGGTTESVKDPTRVSSLQAAETPVSFAPPSGLFSELQAEAASRSERLAPRASQEEREVSNGPLRRKEARNMVSI